MAPEQAKFLWDASQAAQAAQRFIAGKSFDDYVHDDLLRSAVEQQLEILGEALSQFRKLAPSLANTVPDLPRAVALRNILIHAYADVDPRIVWSVVTTQLGGLRARIEQLLEQAGPTAPQ